MAEINRKPISKMNAASNDNSPVSSEAAGLGEMGGEAVRAEVLKLVMEASLMAWWDWRVAEDRMVFRGEGRCFWGGDWPGPLAAGQWFALLHADDEKWVKEQVEACLRGEESGFGVEHRLRTAEGGWCWVVNHGRVIEREASGRARRIIGTTREIEASKRAEVELARDAALLAHIQDAVYCLDENLVFTYWNAGAEGIYGWREAEIMGKAHDVLYPPTSRAAVEVDTRRVLAGGVFAREVEVCSKNGVRGWVDLRSYPLFDVEGRATGLMVVARDVTQRRLEREERLRIEQQTAQAQKMETLGTLAGGIAHDFNNLLAAILGYSEIAAGLLADGHPALAKLNNVTVAGRRAAELVRRILAFSRAGEQAHAPLDMAVLVRETVPLVRASIPSTVEIEHELPEGALVVQGDPTRLQQVLINSCANAAHALQGRSDGCIRLKLDGVRVTGEPPAVRVGTLRPGMYARLAITDNGCGMSDAVLERIFEPFFTTKPKGEGTGFGLAMASGIAMAHGGAIQVDSAPGRGTSFKLFLPTLRQGAAEKVSLPESLIGRGDGQCVAIIDDEESVALLTQQALEHFGYRPMVFNRARDCLERLLDQPDAFQLVITDHTMPEMTGLELIKALRAVGSEVPVLMFSGYGRDLDAEEFARLPRFAFLGKPFELGALLREVHRLIQME